METLLDTITELKKSYDLQEELQEDIKHIPISDQNLRNKVQNALNTLHHVIQDSRNTLGLANDVEFEKFVMDIFHKLDALYFSLIQIGTRLIPGWAHNDLHMGNILYDVDKRVFIVIDLGRNSFGMNITSLNSYKNIVNEWKSLRQSQIDECSEYTDSSEYNPFIPSQDFDMVVKMIGGHNNIYADLAGLTNVLLNVGFLTDEIHNWCLDLLEQTYEEEDYTEVKNSLRKQWNSLTSNRPKFLYIKKSFIWALMYKTLVSEKKNRSVSINSLFYQSGQAKKQIYDDLHHGNVSVVEELERTRGGNKNKNVKKKNNIKTRRK